jgi:hypothetical protein
MRQELEKVMCFLRSCAFWQCFVRAFDREARADYNGRIVLNPFHVKEKEEKLSYGDDV